MTNSEVCVSNSPLHYCVLCEDNGHRCRPREDVSNRVDGRSKLGLMEGANAAPAPIEKAVETSEQGEKDSFEERSIDATMKLTCAMSPAVVLLVQSVSD